MIYTGAGPSSAWPLLVYALLVIFLAAAIIALSYVLGQRHKERETMDPYESGVAITGGARFRFSVRFYLVAMFFVIFDLESAFLFAYAIAFQGLGREAYIGAAVFALALLLMVFYLARTGALDFIAKPRRSPGPRKLQGASAEGR